MTHKMNNLSWGADSLISDYLDFRDYFEINFRKIFSQLKIKYLYKTVQLLLA